MSEMAIAEVQSSRAMAVRPKLTRETLDELSEERTLLGEYIMRHMVEEKGGGGGDYGIIPGTKNRTLLKPGAEKLVSLFRCIPEYEFVEKTEDFDRPLFHYLIRCRIVSQGSGAVVAEGFGSCNSREGKYRWRSENRKCPKCGAEAIMRSKFPPRDAPDESPGWYCYGKKGGCGANFSAGDQTVESQSEGRVENDDVATVVNTILKISKKRALVDAALSLARCSDMFTQDAEDFAELGSDKPSPKATPDKQKPPKPAEDDKPDRELVEEGFRLFDECKNRSECESVAWGIVEDKLKYTAEGYDVLKNYGRTAWKRLPAVKEADRPAPAKAPVGRLPVDESEMAGSGGEIPF